MRRSHAVVVGSTVGLAMLASVLAPTGVAAISRDLAGGTPSATSSQRQPGQDRDAVDALSRLRADSDGQLQIGRDQAGVVTFVGTSAGNAVANPTTSSISTPLQSARADLERYGAMLGMTDLDAQLGTGAATRSVAGGSVVRFTQQVSGVPVIGGEVVVSLDADHRLTSILATTTTAIDTTPAMVDLDSATDMARAVTAKAHSIEPGALRVTGGDLRVFDPAVFGAPDALGPQTVRDFTVSNGSNIVEMVLINATDGRVVLHFNGVENAGLDRMVCDNENVRADQTSCSSADAVRQEGDGAAGTADADDAYDLSGEVSTFYQEVGGIDLTELIGSGASGSRSLLSTVRYCPPVSSVPGEAPCPYANAFWNGTQMFYGQGYAGADDVVGHDITHGVISHNSDLFYGYQSGAINESLADIMGEILDQRFDSPGEDADSWELGEDLPGGAIRDLADPPLGSQPDKMTSNRYFADLSYADAGGVHINSGVGNKTAYLISQGGTFNGITIAGIDGADPDLTKTAKLYLDVIESLTSSSSYADLSKVLVQSCNDLLAAHVAGFTANNCVNVQKATQATELTKQPTVVDAQTPAAAPSTCPAGTTKQVLFNDETGSPAQEFTAGELWARAPAANIGGYSFPTNATSGTGSWAGKDPDPSEGDPAEDSLVLNNAIAVPAGEKTYLRFNHWYLFQFKDSLPRKYTDGGAVLVDDVGDVAGPQLVSALPWINGPTKTIVGSSTPIKGFGGTSNGYISSRLDLSSYAGRTIRPEFQVRGDSSVWFYGWYLDDIEIYTCKTAVAAAPRALNANGAMSGVTLHWTESATAGVSAYRVTRSGGVVRTVVGTSLKVTGLKAATSYTFKVQALNQGGAPGPATTVAVTGTRFTGFVAKKSGKNTVLSGHLLKVGSASGLARTQIVIQKRLPGKARWTTVKNISTKTRGAFSLVVKGATKTSYRVLYKGGSKLIGGTSPIRHL